MSESFDWNYPGLDWSHFHSLANLLSLRNGGQAEPSSLPNTVLEEDCQSDDNVEADTPSLDTKIAHPLSNSGHGRLKRRFLDSLAEFAANKKGGAAVACTAMKEAEDNVIIWIARNEGFSDVDKSAFKRLEELLPLLSGTSTDQSEVLLLNEMVLYQQSRIEHSYIPDLRANFKACESLQKTFAGPATKDSPLSDDTLLRLRRILFDCCASNNLLEKCKTLVEVSYNLRKTRGLREKLYTSSSATSHSKALWENVCLLARVRLALQNFKEIVLALPSFAQIEIELIARPLASSDPSQRPLTLSQTFKTLHLDLNSTTTKLVLGQNWTVPRIEREFAKRQKQKPSIHAEVQLLMFMNADELSASGSFPYLGCSKLSCFLCDRFVRSLGRFTTRGCHGRLFKSWTVPSVDGLLPGSADRIAEALTSVQNEIKRKLKASTKGHIPHERTSKIGGSRVSSEQQQDRSQRQIQITRLRMQTERDRVAEMFRRRTEDNTDSARSTYSSAQQDELDWDCHVCMRPTRRRCTVCNKDFFCSDACQAERSFYHLFTCSKRPLTSADYLWKSCGEDLIPKEEDVLEDFGFNGLLFGGEMSKLFGVYQGLYQSGKFSPEDIHEWRVRGLLIDKIKEFYFAIPEERRGQYFPWFLKNTHLLEHPMTKDEAERKLVATFHDRAIPYLDAEDRGKPAEDLEPRAKAASFHLLAHLLRRMSPNPMESNWYNFGFVTCCGHREECELVDIYLLLLTESDGTFFYEFHNSRRDITQPATFTEFWKAHEARALIQLIDSKGLKKLRSRLRFLERFLSVPPGHPRPSVWDLKVFLEVNDPMDHPPVSSVGVDYGFYNCRTFEDTCTLMEIYGRILQTGDPLELHEACVRGELFQLASRHVRMEERWRVLMRNPYPLADFTEPEIPPEVYLNQHLGPHPEIKPDEALNMNSESKSEVDPLPTGDLTPEKTSKMDEPSTQTICIPSGFWNSIAGVFRPERPE